MHRKLFFTIGFSAVSLALISGQNKNAKEKASDYPVPSATQASAAHQTSGNAGASSKTQNISELTKAALACEWIDPNGKQHTLNALRYLTVPTPKKRASHSLNTEEAADQALSELIEGAPGNEDLYRAALGEPDKDGRPTAQGLAAFLDMLAKANTLNKQKPQDEDCLFNDAQARIEQIFASGDGKQALVKINDSFNSKDNYVALYYLLEKCSTACNGGFKDLEILRAAFEMNTDHLASLVAQQISPSKN